MNEVTLIVFSIIISSIVSFLFWRFQKKEMKEKKGKQITVNLGKDPHVVLNKRGSMELFSFCLDSVIAGTITTEVMKQTFEVWQLLINIAPNISTPKIEVRENTIMLDWMNGEIHLMIHIIDAEWVNFFHIRHESEMEGIQETTNGTIPKWVEFCTIYYQEEVKEIV